ncbi:hypothetical protein HETIRDRAFT_121127 [Heterobasidion irregulare TC 32-1]|uniref:Uncharacterized protein n=1 Tax=Heterobasidion irregulare (strain TC 32-1) TaxID=747525 RepID=W4KHS6_HETIT|nr:uncharacterized protein HETIRDRAFT_121127 [Heterobasidion irregulare TC 32-1]ETW84855.1 hypothetical protein HETIRDRAFT_121127 [Heterobasidion irregulare TC 32-1]
MSELKLKVQVSESKIRGGRFGCAMRIRDPRNGSRDRDRKLFIQKCARVWICLVSSEYLLREGNEESNAKHGSILFSARERKDVGYFTFWRVETKKRHITRRLRELDRYTRWKEEKCKQEEKSSAPKRSCTLALCTESEHVDNASGKAANGSTYWNLETVSAPDNPTTIPRTLIDPRQKQKGRKQQECCETEGERERAIDDDDAEAAWGAQGQRWARNKREEKENGRG